MKRPHVIVLGGGFAGIECCKALSSADVDITIIDRQNHHLFQPLLYQVASAGLAAPEIAHPIRSIFSDQDNVRVVMDEVRIIDPDARTVTTAEDQFQYDYLAIGLGVKTGYFGNDEWAEHAGGLKTLNDATEIRREILLAFEKAEMEEDPQLRKKLMTTAIVGGGPTGVELAGAFAELARHVLKGDFRNIDTSEANVILVEAAPRLLTMYDEKLSEYTRKKLESLGIDVRTEERVTDVGEDFLQLESGRIEAANLIWAAGVQASPVTKQLGVELDPGGRLIVETDLSLPGHPNIFAMGDIAHCIDQAGVRVPGLCPAAMQMGKHVAKVIKDDLKRSKQKAKSNYDVRPQFRYFDKGSMATIGRSAAVASSMGLKFTGFIAWLMWLFIHLLFLVGFRNKIAVLLQWFYAYVRYRRGARIITGVPADGSATTP
ncbi:MAG: NAD(P)/FAD-dependent oxidoreductase [Verrucomicrobiales bacterium]|nr:NAD(P)/FAD-dependent oxidoreductase [Verrucomicrobiales bacterium]